jgi:hypothetical protein
MASSKKDRQDPTPSLTRTKLPRTHKRQALQCKASRRDGERCTQWAMKGTTVCKMHGGKAPQTVQAARARLLAAADPLMAELIALAHNEKLEPSTRLRAIQDALDRAGLGARQAVDVTVKPWEEVLKAEIGSDASIIQIVPDLDDEGDDPDPFLFPHDGTQPGGADTAVSASTRDSELRRRTSTGFEGNRLHRTQGAHHDAAHPPRPSASRRARNRRRGG